MWHYLYFLVLVKVKDPTEYTGPESYVAQMIVVSEERLWIYDCTAFCMLPVPCPTFLPECKGSSSHFVNFSIGLSVTEERLSWLNHWFLVDVLIIQTKSKSQGYRSYFLENSLCSEFSPFCHLLTSCFLSSLMSQFPKSGTFTLLHDS